MAQRLSIALPITDSLSADICALDTSMAVSSASVQSLGAVLMLRLTHFWETGRCWSSHFGRVRIRIVNSHVVDFIVTAQEKVAIA